MARGKAHSDTLKAAVMAALLAGQGVDKVAAEYHLPVSTVKAWRRRAGEFAQVNPEKRDELGELVGEYLRELLVTLKAQVIHMRSPGFLGIAHADSLAVNHGVLADKAFRLLEAAERAEERQPDLP